MRAAAHLEVVPAPSAALEAYFQQYHGLVYRVAYRITGDAADAEDVLQTVFIRLLQRDADPPVSSGAGGYFRRAAVNASLDILRRKRLHVAHPDPGTLRLLPDAVDEPPDPDAPRLPELTARIREALAEVNPRAAEMFVLRYLEEVDNPAIAELLGTSPAVVAVTLFRVRRQLQKKLRSMVGGVA